MQVNQPKAWSTSVDHLWTTRLQQLAIEALFPALKQQLTFENLKQRKSCERHRQTHPQRRDGFLPRPSSHQRTPSPHPIVRVQNSRHEMETRH